MGSSTKWKTGGLCSKNVKNFKAVTEEPSKCVAVCSHRSYTHIADTVLEDDLGVTKSRCDWVINATLGRIGWEKNKCWVCNHPCQIYTEEGNGEGDELVYQIISKIQRERQRTKGREPCISKQRHRRLPWWLSAREPTWPYRGARFRPRSGGSHALQCSDVRVWQLPSPSSRACLLQLLSPCAQRWAPHQEKHLGEKPLHCSGE